MLVLKYYSFENYFLDPEVMSKVGVIKRPGRFLPDFSDKMERISLSAPQRQKACGGAGTGPFHRGGGQKTHGGDQDPPPGTQPV